MFALSESLSPGSRQGRSRLSLSGGGTADPMRWAVKVQFVVMFFRILGLEFFFPSLCLISLLGLDHLHR